MSKIVLCVDDSATMQMVADITFRGTEFTYVGARTSDEALEKVKGSKPALILADAQMPGKSGYDLCLAFKSDAKTADIPVVILVGNAAPFDATRGAAVGVDANLPKPWDTQTMLEKVTEIVGRGSAVKPGAAPPVAAAPPVKPVAAAAAPMSAASAAAAAAAAAAAGMPPRSATIMGMPTIKMPGGVAPTATNAPLAGPAAASAPVAPAVSPAAVAQAAAPHVVSTNKTTPSAVPPVSQSGGNRQPAPPAPAQVHTASRSPMVSGTATKRSALVERTLAKMAAQLAAAAGLEPGSPELLALLKLSTEIVERIVWEVVPELAEAIIKENLHDLTARRS